MLDNHAISAQSLEKHYGINATRFQKQYKNKLSSFSDWQYKEHAKDYLLFPENLGRLLSLDETAFTNGELYTILTNKAQKGKKGSIVMMVKGTRSADVIAILKKIPKQDRDKVEEVTLDMASSMNEIAKTSFRKAKRVTDRFHVQKLAFEALQSIRIKFRWEALEKENKEHKEAKQNSEPFKPEEFSNGDTRKQLLARSRYLLFKSSSKWTELQEKRAKILFKEYPDLLEAYHLAMELSGIYEQKIMRGAANTKMAQWYHKVEKSKFQSFRTVLKSFETHHEFIMNYFDNRSTNAAAESFNSKIKDFRRAFRGVRDINFFLFRLTNIFA